MPRFMLRLVVTVVACVLGACSGAAAKAPVGVPPTPYKMIWGPNTLPNGSSAFPTYKQLGVDVLQEQLNWARVVSQRPANPTDPNDPAYHWDATLDQAAQQAGANGIKIALVVKETPGWANGGRGTDQVPNDDGDYANFLRAAAKRYPSVRFWMVWGEPTRPGNFAPMPKNSPVGPRRYAKLLDRAYGALKAASPRNRVIGGNTETVGNVGAAQFIRDMKLPNGRRPRMDFYGHNPYSTRFPDLSRHVYNPIVRDIDDLDDLHKSLQRAYPKRTPPFWLSEFSISTDHTTRGFAFYVSRPEAARWVTAAYKLVDKVNYVVGLGWYTLLDEDSTASDALTEGLLDKNGTPKPAFAAYQQAP